MKKINTISYQNRYGTRNIRPTAPKLMLANFYLKNISKFDISSKVSVEYLKDKIIISKI